MRSLCTVCKSTGCCYSQTTPAFAGQPAQVEIPLHHDDALSNYSLLSADVPALSCACSPNTSAQCMSLSRTALQLVRIISSTPSPRKSTAQLSSMSCEDIYAAIKADSGVYKYYCNGEWKESTSGNSVPVINPTSQEKDYAVQGKCLKVMTASEALLLRPTVA